MPPIRTFTPVKPVKTERSHEENQERAYIAASRRSDRSLEARVESARRASEIHKRRTGRSLRVTEQDVINEEMYEEEDDDIPAQYRRLTQHMNTGSADFNRRLTAYLSNHVAMRHALGEALSSSYQQFPNGTPWAQSMHAMQSPSGNQITLHYPPNGDSPAMLPPLSAKSPQPLTSSSLAPSSVSHPSSSLSSSSSSTATLLPQGSTSPASASLKPKPERRASEPLHPKPEDGSSKSVKDLEKSASVSPYLSTKDSPANAGLADSSQSQYLPMSNPQYPPTPTSFSNTLAYHNAPKFQPHSYGPLSTALPPETRMFSSAGFDPNDPFGNRMWNDNKNPSFAVKLEGMNQTLAPSAFDAMVNDMDWSRNAQSDDNIPPYSAPPFMYNIDDAFNNSMSKDGLVDDVEASGQLTPTQGDWASLIDQSSWEDGTG